MTKNIGVFSGTFDPIHQGHVSFVHSAIERGNLDEVRIIVERHPSNKQPKASAAHRLAMVQLAFSNEDRVVVSYSREKITMINDICELFATGNMHILIGSDILPGIETWQDIDIWASRISLVIGLREPDTHKLISIASSGVNFKSLQIIEHSNAAIASSSTRRDPSQLLSQLTVYVEEHRLYR